MPRTTKLIEQRHELVMRFDTSHGPRTEYHQAIVGVLVLKVLSVYALLLTVTSGREYRPGALWKQHNISPRSFAAFKEMIADI